MMHPLLILGVGPHAAEMAQLVERINAAQPMWRLIGFVAPAGHRGHAAIAATGLPVLGGAAVLSRHERCHLAFDHEFRDPIDVPRQRWATLIDPTAMVAHNARLGAGCVVYPHAFIGADAQIGDRLFMLAGAAINHDDHLGENVTLCSGATLAGSVNVGDNAYLGQACSVRQHVNIGRGSVVGMGAVVLKDVPAGSTVAGNPARLLTTHARSTRDGNF